MKHGGRVYEYAAATGRKLADVLDFSANINPLGPPESAMEALLSALPLIRHYPDARHTAIKHVIAGANGIPADSLFCGNGAIEVLELIFRAIQPKRTFVFSPAFSEYERIARLYGSSEQIPLDIQETVRLPLDRFNRRLQAGDAVVLNNPHNPSGVYWAKSDWMKHFTMWAEAGVFILIDESFIDFLPNPEDVSAVGEAACRKRIFVIQSATKIFSIPGLRFGFGVAVPEMVDRIEQTRDSWSVNALALAAASAAYQDHAFIDRTRGWLREEQSFIRKTWGSHEDIHVYPTSVNFFLARFLNGDICDELERGLQSNGMFVRRCSQFTGLGREYLRIAIKTRADNERLWREVSRLLDLRP